MEVRAIARNVRVSPEKLRLLVAQIKKLPPQKAVLVLGSVSKSSAPVLRKVILSAMANAKNNYQLAEKTFKFKEIQVGKGPVFKRYQPVSRGRVHPILKRTSNIRVVIEGEEAKKVSKVLDVSQVSQAKNKK